MSVKTSNTRDIGYLLNKYETKQPGEKWDTKREKENGKPAWNMKQKIRTAQIMMSRLNIKGNDKERVIHIIKDIDDFKHLCKNCSCETIIATICFYVLKSSDSNTHIDRFSLWSENNLSWKKYSLIISRILTYYQKKTFIKL